MLNCNDSFRSFFFIYLHFFFSHFLNSAFVTRGDDFLSCLWGRSIDRASKFGKRDDFTAVIAFIVENGNIYKFACVCVYARACVRKARFDVALKAFLFFCVRVTRDYGASNATRRNVRVLGRPARAWFTLAMKHRIEPGF